MNSKRILVSFLLIASVLFLASAVSALGTSSETVKVNDVDVASASVIAGDTIEVKVAFTADNALLTWVSASDVRMKVTLEGDKGDVTSVTPYFDMKDGKVYTKTLTLKVPSDFDNDELSKDLTLSVKIWNSDDEVDFENEYSLSVQRPSYDVAIKSVMVDNSVDAGQVLPVDVVIKNVGYNEANDLYITVSIPELNIEKKVYFGDLVTTAYDGTDEDAENTVSGRLYLEIPYGAKSGVYALEVTAENDETSNTVKQDLTVINGFPDIAMKSGNDLVLLNPTNQLKVYTVAYGTTQLSVIVPAASSKNVQIETPTSGEYNFDVSVLSGETLLSKVNFSGTANQSVQLTSPVMVLTVILAVVFLVLLVVLVVLITKKPQKAEEFGESYY